MKKISPLLLIIFLLVHANIICAQVTDVVDAWWKHEMIATLNLSQMSVSDWQPGGEDYLSYIASVKGKTIQDLGKTNWATCYNFAFGQTKVGTQGIRKVVDLIDLSTMLTYKVGILLNQYVVINPYAKATFVSQFTTGYNYYGPAPIAINDFLDPATATFSVGLAYSPIREFNTTIGIGIEGTFTKTLSTAADDPLTLELERTRIKGMLTSTTNIAIQLDSNILYTSKLDLTGRFKTLNKIKVYWDHTIMAMINKIISTNLTLHFVNNIDLSPRTQIQEILSIGINYRIM